MTGRLPTLALCGLILAGCSSGVPLPGRKADDGATPRVALASQARAEARARKDDGSWADPQAIQRSKFRSIHPDRCTADARGLACTDEAPVRVEPATGITFQGRVAIAFAALPDGSRCFGEARQGQPRDENILVVRAYQGGGGVVPRARSLGRIAGTGDPLAWEQVADPSRFLTLCQGMGAAPAAVRKAG